MMRAMRKLLVAAVMAMLWAPASPRATHPLITWDAVANENFLRVDGASTLTISANPYGAPSVHGSVAIPFTTLFQQAAANGTRIVRIHVPTSFNYLTVTGDTEDGEWIDAWDAVFDEAETYRLNVLPVLDVWANWDTSMGWNNNIFSAGSTGYNCATFSDCGPAATPADLLVDESPTQLAWLAMMEYWVTNFKDHDNI